MPLPTIIIRSLVAFPIASLWLLPLPAGAQSQQSPRYSSRDEYRACLEEADRIEPRRVQLQKGMTTHNAELKQLQDEMDQHIAQQDKLDNTDDAAIDAFNARLDVLNAGAGELNAEVERLNHDQAVYNHDIAAVNRRCAGMVVTIRDHNAVIKERTAAGKGQTIQ
ncbi:MAG: hypothetical protein JWQ90_4783 [Hydrocarboniphaga sp.]|uniref:hypothetical protein n=1 Tax=Hydrocarboniphaga sp. TaxID=2033016 RepID=UPI00261775E5|nr:hypothetical protein [Hydrocarboniphaga sp.]MDB5972333.1 hypothetical protein [Hydrocarboniphaga sp.]